MGALVVSADFEMYFQSPGSELPLPFIEKKMLTSYMLGALLGFEMEFVGGQERPWYQTNQRNHQLT